MLNYEVDAWPNKSYESLTIRVRTFDRGCKEGFTLEFSEEWLLRRLHKIAELEGYPTVGISDRYRGPDNED